MQRDIVVIGAPSSIGIRPYADRIPRRLDLTPGVLRKNDLRSRLKARDAGDVLPPPRYQDLERPQGRPRNEEDILVYSRAIADRIAALLSNDEFVLLLGGDCSILLGALLGFRNSLGAGVGLVYVDAHADFATLESSPSGSAASMCLALATGRNDTRLAHLTGNGPLVNTQDVALLGRKDDAEPWYGHADLTSSPALNIPCAAIQDKGASYAAQAALERVAQNKSSRYWIHVDVDVLDPKEMPAVDSPLPGGLGFSELQELTTSLANNPRALGLQLTIYDPTLDPDGSCASRLVTLLENSLRGTRAQAGNAR
jgi:arginase